MFSLTELFKLNDYFNLFCYKKLCFEVFSILNLIFTIPVIVLAVARQTERARRKNKNLFASSWL